MSSALALTASGMGSLPMPLTHPCHARRVRQVGTLAGLSVWMVAISVTGHPDAPRSAMDVGGHQAWVKIAAAPWTRTDRPVLVERWVDPRWLSVVCGRPPRPAGGDGGSRARAVGLAARGMGMIGPVPWATTTPGACRLLAC